MDLVDYLVQHLHISRRQAAGGAGLLLEYAQCRLGPERFAFVAQALPAISDILGQAPRVTLPPRRPLWELLRRAGGGLGGLAGLVEGFAELGLEKQEIFPLALQMMEYFRQQGQAEVAALLRGVLH